MSNPTLYPAQSTLAPLSTIGSQIVAKLKAITLSDGKTSAFPSVALYDLGDLLTALKELVVSGDRAAVVFIEGETWAASKEGNNLVSTRRVQFSVLAVDTDQGSRNTALTGLDDLGRAVQPGAFGLRDLLLGINQNQPPQPWLIGFLNSSTFIQPSHGSALILRDASRNELAGRAGWIAGFEAVGGRIVSDLGRFPII